LFKYKQTDFSTPTFKNKFTDIINIVKPNEKLANLSFLAQQVVEGFIIGLHKSPFHGFSVEFAEHRLYNPGDNLKHIDWKVYGRTDKLFIKRYEEETNLRSHVVIDTSSSMLFPDEGVEHNKLGFSCMAAAALFQLFKKQLDAGALNFFDQSIYYQSQCRSNSTHYNHLITQLENKLSLDEKLKGTNTANVLHQIADNTHRRSLVILFSDMLDRVSEKEELLDALKHLKFNKHEVILFHVQDKQKEVEFEYENRPYEFVDLESGEKIKMNSNALKKTYSEQMNAYRAEIALKCLQYGIDLVDADINKGYEQILLPYLLKRNAMV
jgi:uncharacterized protein (DUF58 family)